MPKLALFVQPREASHKIIQNKSVPQLISDCEEPADMELAFVHEGAPLHTLLYIGDNPANLKLVEQLIARRPNLRLLSARDGGHGVEIARTGHPDVILMDLNLPGISGADALKILREDRLTANIPVVAVSANAMPRDIEMGLLAGFSAISPNRSTSMSP